MDMQDAKEQVRQAIDIVDLVGSHVSLRRQGRGYVAICPWHEDSRPSLSVNPQRQSFKCWVCDIGGDIFSFVMRAEGVEFREALEMLAERAGIQLGPSKQGEQENSEFQRRRLFEAVAWTAQQFHLCLREAPEAEPARAYLADRGISDESIQRFQIGFAPAEWDWLLGRARSTEWSPAVLERVGLAIRRESGEGLYDRFRGRLIFPINDAQSRPIAFGGRVLPGVGDDSPAKYINSPETPLFSKSNQLYALDLARDAIAKEKNIAVMEGYTDVIMAHQHGIANAVAVLGTALGERHVPVIRRFTDSITLVLDGDTAGQSRTMQILDDLLALFVTHEVDLKILTLPQGTDPCDVIASQGSEAFRHMLSQAVDAIEHKIIAVTNGLAANPGTHRSTQAVEEILSTLARALPAKAGASSTFLLREQQVLTQLARKFGMSEEPLRTRLVALRRQQASRRRDSRAVDESEVPVVRSATVSPWERELLELLVSHPEVIASLATKMAPEDIPGEDCRRLYARVLQSFQDTGEPMSFDRLLLETDDETAKSLLVDCDERGQEKLTSNVDRRLHDVLSHLQNRKQDARYHATVAELKQNPLHFDQQQEEKLSEVFDVLKRRQAGSSPTDG